MKKLKVELKNCYGIKELQHVFDFADSSAFAIYAPNGVMKSSFAQVFSDIAASRSSQDRIFSSRTTAREVVDETGAALSPESILVLQPYSEAFGHNEKTSTLLVNQDLRREYEQLHQNVKEAQKLFLKALKEQSGSKKNLETEIVTSFRYLGSDFQTIMLQVESELDEFTETQLSQIDYDRIFDEKVLDFLNISGVKALIKDYIEKYNQLIGASKYFKRGIFNYYNASSVAKSLKENGFFDAQHSISLNSEERKELNALKELEDLIQEEKEKITADQGLKAKFTEIEKQLNKNKELRDFHNYLLEEPHILSELSNLSDFRKKILKAYIYSQRNQYRELLKNYTNTQSRKREIEQIANEERTDWEAVIEIFNKRFYVPFKLVAKNRLAVVLGQENLLSLGFKFEDGDDFKELEKTELMRSLSTGEKKALYILNIIFEVETRKRNGQKTLFIFDDIADSFDYKNKYAIIEYLIEISEQPLFTQLILTHNFDFYRTINSRFISYSGCLMTCKSNQKIVLEKATGIKNVFVKDWKKKFHTDKKKMIASIPFIRNIIEYTKSVDDPDYLKLTSMLHWKADSAAIKTLDLVKIFNKTFTKTGEYSNGDESIIELIESVAQSCLTAPEGINLENKIVLAISTRLKAEKFMIEKIDNPAFVASIKKNQTVKLFQQFKNVFHTEISSIEKLQRVVLMTPESIHLNSFMYEPIVDMSDEHLRELFKDIVELTETV